MARQWKKKGEEKHRKTSFNTKEEEDAKGKTSLDVYRSTREISPSTNRSYMRAQERRGA